MRYPFAILVLPIYAKPISRIISSRHTLESISHRKNRFSPIWPALFIRHEMALPELLQKNWISKNSSSQSLTFSRLSRFRTASVCQGRSIVWRFIARSNSQGNIERLTSAPK
ncbi:hypothetical protein TNIN_288171 [Trichonephila inaurata madagascariensis]|uniref:Uncharacterized protein n=1 Tax=Trichonephila inaurata madagascariensis TaxID=2747483 RepID=A0A8X7C5W1_9ARAC|nr:hypothetical protein TNIN_288171 [Trichonephila inaurata madagascariensis]